MRSQGLSPRSPARRGTPTPDCCSGNVLGERLRASQCSIPPEQRLLCSLLCSCWEKRSQGPGKPCSSPGRLRAGCSQPGEFGGSMNKASSSPARRPGRSTQGALRGTWGFQGCSAGARRSRRPRAAAFSRVVPLGRALMACDATDAVAGDAEHGGSLQGLPSFCRVPPGGELRLLPGLVWLLYSHPV